MQALQDTETWPICDDRSYATVTPEWDNHPRIKTNIKHNIPEAYSKIRKDFDSQVSNCDWSAVWNEVKIQMELCDQKTVDVMVSQSVSDFNRLADKWRRDTSFQSSLIAKFMHDDYQTIMAMGEPVIPLILARLKRTPEHWFWALKHLAKGYDAAADCDNPVAATKAWLTWGEEKGYNF